MLRKRSTGTPDVSPETIAILLHGWSAHPPAGLPRTHGFSGGLLTCYEAGGPARLWREHAHHLLQTAKAWRWAPTCTGPDGVRRCFAEALAWEADQGEHHPHGVPTLHTVDGAAIDDEPDEAADEAE